MEHTREPVVVGVRFSKVGKVYHFSADLVTDIKVGDQVVVETSRGWQLGQVAQIVQNAEPPSDGWKPIDRRATPRDLLLRQMWQMKEAEVVTSCRNKSNDLNLVGIKIVSAEYSFDGSRLTILFSSETEEKYDLKSLRSDMQKMYAPSQVEMRQIGPRDVAKTVCGMGACGLETRCCCLFLTEFSSISIRMAKEQGISLTPTEITGMCGRLRCCLIYEYDNYVEARAKLPKRNKRVRTPQGEGKVVDVVPLRGAVIVELPEVGHREFLASEILTLDANGQPEPGQTPPAPPSEPFHGTEQPSVMDQVITGEETLNPFVISSQSPPPESNWENPPKVEQPRSMPVPRGKRPEGQRPGGPRQGGERRDRREMGGRREPGAGGGTPGEGQPQQGGERQRPEQRQGEPRQSSGGRDRGPRQGRSQGGRGPQGDRPQPGERAPQGERGGQPGERPQQNERPPRQGDQQQPGGRGPRRESRPQRPQGGPRQPGDQQRGADQPQRNADQSQRSNEPSQRPADQTPRAGNEAGGGNSPRGGQDNRRKKGRRRDNNEPEERA